MRRGSAREMRSLSHTDQDVSSLLKFTPYVLALMRLRITEDSYRELSLNDLAKILSTTVQNAHRIVKKLEEENIIERNGKLVKFSIRGQQVVKYIINTVKQYLEDMTIIELAGTVVSGLGEGRYYMSIEEYRTQFKEKLGFEPYPGTLNVKLYPDYIKNRLLLSKLPGIMIHGFEKNGRKFGSVKCFKARIENFENIPCAVLIIEKTHHGPEIIEVIAPVKLRDELKLVDGSPIKIRVFID